MRDHALMGVTTAARTAVQLGTLLILARTLGPRDFGFISIVITWSTIVALVTDYGFGMRALREIAIEMHSTPSPDETGDGKHDNAAVLPTNASKQR